MEQEEQEILFNKAFDVSIKMESIDFEIHEDDGMGNSHLKGVLQLNNGLYGRITFDIKRVNREVEKASIKLFDREIKFYDFNQDTRINGIREESNIFISYMNHIMEGYDSVKPFWYNDVYEPIKKKWWQFWKTEQKYIKKK
jgi:hypothetical protein